VPIPLLRFAHHNDYDVPSVVEISVPSREQSGVSEAGAPSDLIRVKQHFLNSLAMFGQQIRMAFRNMALALLSKLDLSVQVGRRKARHRGKSV